MRGEQNIIFTFLFEYKYRKEIICGRDGDIGGAFSIESAEYAIFFTAIAYIHTKRMRW